MTDAIMYLLSAIVLIIGALLGIEKRKTKKANKRAETAETERDKAERQTKLEQTASQIKDDLAKDKATLSKEKEEVVQSITDIPESKEVELSEEVKKLAADQSTRANAERVPVNRSKGSRVQNPKR